MKISFQISQVARPLMVMAFVARPEVVSDSGLPGTPHPGIHLRWPIGRDGKGRGTWTGNVGGTCRTKVLGLFQPWER